MNPKVRLSLFAAFLTAVLLVLPPSQESLGAAVCCSVCEANWFNCVAYCDTLPEGQVQACNTACWADYDCCQRGIYSGVPGCNGHGGGCDLGC